MANKYRLFCAIVAAVLLSSCGETPNQLYQGFQRATPGPIATPTPVGAFTPRPGAIYFGAWENPNNPVAYNNAKNFERYLNLTERRIAIDQETQPWLAKLPDLQATGDLAVGRLYMLNWNCGPLSLAQIASGQADLLITTLAQMFKIYGHAAMLRFMWDPNMPNWYRGRQSCYDRKTDNPDGTFSAANYVAAWRHMHAIFQSNGVSNVIWVWSFNSAGVNPVPYYPGGDVVDWVGMDAYATPYVSFETTFNSPYATATTFNKPVMISETGATTQYQANFFSGAAYKLRTMFPAVQAFIYYDSPSASAGGVDYTVATPIALADMQGFVHDPYLAATPGPL